MLQGLWASTSLHSFIFLPFFFSLNIFVHLPHFPSDMWFKLFWYFPHHVWLYCKCHILLVATTESWVRNEIRLVFTKPIFTFCCLHLCGNRAVWKTRKQTTKQKNSRRIRNGIMKMDRCFKFGQILLFLFLCLFSSQLCSQYNCIWLCLC